MQNQQPVQRAIDFQIAAYYSAVLRIIERIFEVKCLLHDAGRNRTTHHGAGYAADGELVDDSVVIGRIAVAAISPTGFAGGAVEFKGDFFSGNGVLQGSGFTVFFKDPGTIFKLNKRDYRNGGRYRRYQGMGWSGGCRRRRCRWRSRCRCGGSRCGCGRRIIDVDAGREAEHAGQYNDRNKNRLHFNSISVSEMNIQDSPVKYNHLQLLMFVSDHFRDIWRNINTRFCVQLINSSPFSILHSSVPVDNVIVKRESMNGEKYY